MKYYKFLGISVALLCLFTAKSSFALVDSVSVTNTFTPAIITYPTANMSYTAKVTTTNEAAVRAACGSSDIFVYITPAATGQKFAESDLVASPTKTVQGTFVENPQSQFSITYTTQVKCGTGYATVLAQTTNTLQTQGQPSGGGAVGVTFDATPTSMNGSSGTFNFKLAYTGKQADLDSKCGTGKSMIWTIYQTAVPNQLGDATEVKRGSIPQTSFGAGTTITVSPDPSATVTNPGHTFYFQARATCDGSTTALNTSGPAPTTGVTVSGSGSTDPNNFNTTVPAGQNNTFTFNITNPLNGGPNNLFDIIDIATKWLLQLSIPLAVLWIMYAGFLMLTAGDKPANFEKGKKVLTYTVLGLAIIFIGRGFITLIVSIIELGGSSSTPTTQTQTQSQTQTAPQTQTTNTVPDSRPVQPGDECAASDQQPCGSTLVCGSQGMCQYSGGNHANDPCYTDANCQSGTTCQDNPLGSGKVCIPPQPGDKCIASDQQPCGSTLVCGGGGMCQYSGGNHADQACYTDANCQSGTTCKKNPLGSGNVCVAN